MSKQSSKIVSVFVPTYNGEKYLGECIEGVLNQELPKGHSLELIVIDSGSTDHTLEILELYKDRITLHQIPNSEFSHGGTRQLAAEMAKGDFIIYLSQDATPSHYRWLINMIEPFFISDKVGCVFGRQVPRPNAAATIKREVSGVFNSLAAQDTITLHRTNSLVDNATVSAPNTFFSDVNSAVRRSLLVGEVPFRPVRYSEDQALAEDMLERGYLKAYTPLGSVWHSNEYSTSEYFRRKFDEYIGLQESVGYAMTPSRKSVALGWIRPTLKDWQFILHDREYSLKSKILWSFKSPFYNISERRGRYWGLKSITDRDKRQKLSLEAQRKNNNT